MKRTQSAYALLLAILASFGAIAIIATPVNKWIQSQPSLAEWISTATYGAALLFFFTVYGALQSRQAKRQLQQETSLLVFPCPQFHLTDAAAGILIIVLVLLLPSIRIRTLSLARILVTGIDLLAYFGLLKLSQNNLSIMCTRHHLLISGFDVRIMIPDPNGRFAYANPTGILPYDRIAGFNLIDSRVTLFMKSASDAPVSIFVADETAKQFEGIMAMHRIPRWYPENV